LPASFSPITSCFATTFDEDLARTSGVRVTRVTTLLTVLTAVTVVLSMRLVGVMLISALLIIPASTALSFSAGFRATILLSMVIAIVSVIAGVILSVIANLPTGATIIVVCLALFLLATGYDSYRRSAAGGA
jgi:zinc transport system permease protein